MAKNLKKYIEPPMDDGQELVNIHLQERQNRPKLDMRSIMENVFTELGGEAGMVNWVKKSTANERIFYRDIVGKLIPREDKMTVKNEGSVNLLHSLNLKNLTDDELLKLQQLNDKLNAEEAILITDTTDPTDGQ